MSNEWNIKDDEIRIIGSDLPPQGSKEDKSGNKGTLAIWLLSILAVLLLAGIIILLGKRRTVEPDEPGLFETGDTVVVHQIKNVEVLSPFGDYSDTTGLAYTEIIQKTINDIPLSIYIPHNAVPELCLKAPDYRDKNIILAAQAADIRRDNKKIVGAFVLKGEPLAWGLSKKGYCGIIDGKLTVGVADNSPLFEEATETEGYFFRQYPLVDNEYKKHKLTIDVSFPTGESDIERYVPEATKKELLAAGRKAKSFIDSTTVKHPGIQYLLIIEGQASKDPYQRNYELSYERALSLKKFWEKGDAKGPILFTEKNCEVLICGSGDGRQSGTGLMRETNEKLNQRFLIHILPKPGVIEQVKKQ